MIKIEELKLGDSIDIENRRYTVWDVSAPNDNDIITIKVLNTFGKFFTACFQFRYDEEVFHHGRQLISNDETMHYRSY